MLIAATSPLLFLALLACPIGMGLMMLFMGRGMMGGGGMKKTDSRQSDDGSPLAEMKAEQARLAEKIEALEGQQPNATGPATDREHDPVS